MNLPFQFTFTTTNHIGALWNPYGVTTGINEDNEILTGLLNPLAVGINQPLGSVCLTSICVMTDDGGDGAVSIGYYDTDTAAFVKLYAVPASAVAGGGFSRDFGDGFRIPSGPTKVAALRYDGSAGGLVTGDVRLWVDQEFASMVPPNANV